jgi:hypothetical protein
MMLMGLTMRGWLIWLCVFPLALLIVYLIPGHSLWVAGAVGAVCSLTFWGAAKAVQR